MKAIVLEIKNGKAAVLREDGVVLEVRGTYEVGETVEWKEKQKLSFRMPAMRMVLTAAAIVLALLFGGVYNYTTVQAAGYVAVEDDIGLELVLNRRSQVIEIRATDESGEQMKQQLEELHIKGASLEKAIDAVNEIRREEIHEKDPEAEWAGFTFRAVSDDEKMQERFSSALQEHQPLPKEAGPLENSAEPSEQGRPEEPSQPSANTAAPAEPDGQEAPKEQPQEIQEENHPAGTPKDQPEGDRKEEPLPDQPSRGEEGAFQPQEVPERNPAENQNEPQGGMPDERKR